LLKELKVFRDYQAMEVHLKRDFSDSEDDGEFPSKIRKVEEEGTSNDEAMSIDQKTAQSQVTAPANNARDVSNENQPLWKSVLGDDAAVVTTMDTAIKYGDEFEARVGRIIATLKKYVTRINYESCYSFVRPLFLGVREPQTSALK
jgi:hypothetical protein